jgi:hypothetical protein
MTLPGTSFPLLSIAGSNNEVSCGQGWNTILNASAYTVNLPGGVIEITGSGNRLKNCQLVGSYLNSGTVGSGGAIGSDCIQVSGTNSAANDNVIEHNLLQYCGNRGIYAQDTFRTKIRDNYVSQSWAAGIQASATANPSLVTVSSANGDISYNTVQDTELQYNESALNPRGGAGNGDINITSPGSTTNGAPGLLRSWLVHDNYVINTSPVCNSENGPSSGDHGCSEGIQVTEFPWSVHVYNNYVYNTGSEGITLCQYDCSATGNYVGNSAQNCKTSGFGCGGIIQSVQASQTGANPVFLLEKDGDVRQFLKEKINAAILDKNPFHEPLRKG